jgi:hypothetical protein
MTEQRRPIKRPPRWLRIIAAVVAVVYGFQLIFDHSLANVISTAVLCPLFLTFAIAPRGLFDGRFDVWTRRHRVTAGSLVFVFLGALGMSALADTIGWWPALGITVPVAGVLAWFGAYVARPRSERTGDAG